MSNVGVMDDEGGALGSSSLPSFFHRITSIGCPKCATGRIVLLPSSFSNLVIAYIYRTSSMRFTKIHVYSIYRKSTVECLKCAMGRIDLLSSYFLNRVIASICI